MAKKKAAAEAAFSEKEINAGLLDFIRRSPNAFFAAENIAESLRGAGFAELRERDAWTLEAGGNYFVRRNGSALIAFRMPKRREPADGVSGNGVQEIPGCRIYAAHCDSPSFRITPRPEIIVEGKYVKLNTEPYGGMLMSTWPDRPLSVAGRVVVRAGEGTEVRLVNIDRDLLVIPNLAIHMDRKQNDGKAWNAQNDLLPLFAEAAEPGAFVRLITEAAGAGPEDLLSADLYLYNRQPGTLFGAEEEFLAAPRLDDLQCVYAGLRGFLAAADAGTPGSAPRAGVPVFCVLDNEEVGSSTKQGAASTFLKDTLMRICASPSFSGMEESDAAGGVFAERYLRMIAGSFMVSADNAHGIHPNDTSKADPTNRPVLNGGVVIKYSGNQKYASDAVSGAVFRKICEQAGVPVQTFANRSDVPGGSTLGNISGTKVAVSTVDIGLAQLAMHSAYETAGAHDTCYMAAAARQYFETEIRLPE